jgi:hypothetical protein
MRRTHIMKNRLSIALATLGVLASAPSAVAYDFGPTVWMPDLEAGFSIAAMSFPFGTLSFSYSNSNDTKDILGSRWCTALFPGNDEFHPVELDFKAIITPEKVTFVRCGRAEGGWDFDLKARLPVKRPAEDLRAYVSIFGGRVEIHQSDYKYASVLTARTDGIEIKDRASDALLKFNWEGDIVAIGDAKIVRDRGRIVALEGPLVSARLDYDGRLLRSIRNDDGLESMISYDAGRVSTVSTAWSKAYRIDYRENGDLQEVVYPDQKRATFFYATGTSKVTGLIERNGCFELYEQAAGVDEDNFKMQTKRRCGDHWAATRVLTLKSIDGKRSYRKADQKDKSLGDDETRIAGKPR